MRAGTATSRDLESVTECILVELAKKHDQEAFSELVRRSTERCLGIATSILRNRDDAAEEVQNAFWKAYTRIELINKATGFSSWVSRIVINGCFSRVRRARIARLVPYEAADQRGDFYVSYEPQTHDTPEQQLGQNEVVRILRRELALIPKALRVPIELHYLEEMSLDDISRELNLTLATTRSRLHRGRGYLRSRMIRHCGIRGIGTLTRSLAL